MPSPMVVPSGLNQRGRMASPLSAALRAARCFVSSRSFCWLACRAQRRR